MVTTRKIGPRNLAGIKKHLERQKKDNNVKINGLKKKLVSLEQEQEVIQDGIDWCDQVYEASKSNGTNSGTKGK